MANHISDRTAHRGRTGGVTMYISYRRADTGWAVRRLYDALAAHFGQHRVFVDIDHIAPGANFIEETKKAMGSFGIVLVMIGRNWLSATDYSGTRLLDKPADFVRVELEAVLERGAHVIPILVDNAVMPAPDELPPSLATIANRHAANLRVDTWAVDVEPLIATLHQLDEAATGIAWNKITPLSREATQ